MHFSGRMGDGIHASFLFFFLFSREATSIKYTPSVRTAVRLIQFTDLYSPQLHLFRLFRAPSWTDIVLAYICVYVCWWFAWLSLSPSLYRGIIAVIQLPRTYSRKYSLSRTKLISLSTMRDWNLSTKIISHRCHCWRKLKTLILKSPGQF